MKIPTEDFTGVTLVMMLEVAMGVMDMEDDKVADMVLMIPNEDFSDGTVVILMEMMLEVMMWVLDMEVDKMVQSGG